MEGCVTRQRVRLVDRARARLCADALDRRLAAGSPPDEDAALAVHARSIVQPAARRTLAGTLERLAGLGEQPTGTCWPTSPLNRALAGRAAADLRAAAHRLTARGPISARAVAQLRLLVGDGSGPLYRGGAADDLSLRLRRTLAVADARQDWFI